MLFWNRVVRFAPFAAILMGIAACADLPSSELSASSIINGDVVPRGSLASLGVVKITASGGTTCTGTMMSNTQVVTARHCVREFDNGTFGNYLSNVAVTLEGSSPALDQHVQIVSILEPNNGTSTWDPDVVVVNLAAPLTVADSSDSFANLLYPGSSASLVGASVFCAGYGISTLATESHTTLGSGVLRSGNFTVSITSGFGFLSFAPVDARIPAYGDSGGPCFSAGLLVGVAKALHCSSHFDLNHNNVDEPQECASISASSYSGPDIIRDLVDDWTHTSIVVDFDYSPASAAQPLVLQIDTPVSSVELTTDGGGAGVVDDIPVGGRVLTTVTTEPPSMLCTRPSLVAPSVAGTLVRGACISDGAIGAVVGSHLSL